MKLTFCIIKNPFSTKNFDKWRIFHGTVWNWTVNHKGHSLSDKKYNYYFHLNVIWCILSMILLCIYHKSISTSVLCRFDSDEFECLFLTQTMGPIHKCQKYREAYWNQMSQIILVNKKLTEYQCNCFRKKHKWKITFKSLSKIRFKNFIEIEHLFPSALTYNLWYKCFIISIKFWDMQLMVAY